MNKVAAVFFDFDGVLCTDRFYTTLLPDYPHVVEWISAHVFSGEKYCDIWMRGELNRHDIKNIIARATDLSPGLLDERLLSSVRKMTVNPALIQFAEALKQKGVKVALVTSNMDVFNEITVPEKHLDEIFPVIANSFDYKLMKQDEDGRLFDIALRRLGLRSYEDVLLVDDSTICCDIFKKKGGKAYLYRDQQAFLNWAEKLIK